MSGTLSRGDQSRSDRGYTHVDYGQARVGNRWLERSWSAFLGHTTSLLQHPGETEWVVAHNDEYSVTVEGDSLGVNDFGEVEWSESLNELGATLVATHHHDALALRVEHTVLHDAPALIRSVTLINHGTRTIEIERLAFERFTLEAGVVQFFMGDLTRVAESEVPVVGRPVGALRRGAQGFLFIDEGEGTIELRLPESGACSVGLERKRMLAPSHRWECGQSMLVAFEGDPNDALGSLLPDIRRRIQTQERLDAERAREDT